MWIQSPGQEDLLEESLATHCSVLAWRIPWTEEPGGLQSMGSQSWTRLSDLAHPTPQAGGEQSAGHTGVLECRRAPSSEDSWFGVGVVPLCSDTPAQAGYCQEEVRPPCAPLDLTVMGVVGFGTRQG